MNFKLFHKSKSQICFKKRALHSSLFEWLWQRGSPFHLIYCCSSMQGLHLQNYASLLEQIPPVYQPTLKHFIVIRFWFLVTHRIFKSVNESDLKSCNVLFFTGLSNIIRKIVLEQLGYFMVLPNKITVPLSDKVDTKDLKCPDYAGVLRWDSTKYVYFCDIYLAHPILKLRFFNFHKLFDQSHIFFCWKDKTNEMNGKL